MNTRFAIAMVGAAGLLVIIQAALDYAGVDHLAQGITLAIGGALLAGVLGWWLSAARAAAVQRAAHAQDPTLPDAARAFQSLTATVERTGEGLERALGLVQERLSAGADAERMQQDRTDALLTRLEATATALREVQVTQADTLQRFVSATDDRLRESEQHAQQRLADLESAAQQRFAGLESGLQHCMSTSDDRLRESERGAQQRLADLESAALQRLADFEAGLQRLVSATDERQQDSDARAQQRLADFETQATQRLAAYVERLQQAANDQAERLARHEEALREHRVKEDLGAQARLQGALSQLAERGAALGEHHGQAASILTEQATRAIADTTEHLSKVGERLLQAEALLIERHEALAEQSRAQAEAQVTRLSEIEQTIAAQHGKRTEALCELFDKQLVALQNKLDTSTALVAEAAELVRSGGAELVTVAETFGAAVEQQRQAASQWLESLGDMERLVVNAGEHAAADVLGQHLARTHEVFERQLRFQQALIEQLQGEPKHEGNQGQVADASL